MTDDSLPTILSLDEVPAHAGFRVLAPIGLGDDWSVEALQSTTSFGPYVELRGRRADGATFVLAQMPEGGTARMAATAREIFCEPGLEGVAELGEIAERLRGSEGREEADFGGIPVRLVERGSGAIELYFERDAVECTLLAIGLRRDEVESMVRSLSVMGAGGPQEHQGASNSLSESDAMRKAESLLAEFQERLQPDGWIVSLKRPRADGGLMTSSRRWPACWRPSHL
jgi:hypothetical protein